MFGFAMVGFAMVGFAMVGFGFTRVAFFFTIVSVNSFAFIFMADILVISVNTVNMFFYVVSYISNNNMIVNYGFLYFVLSRFDSVAMLNSCFNVLAMVKSFNEISIIASIFNMMFHFVTWYITSRTTCVVVMMVVMMVVVMVVMIFI
jgi:hypothetical protein